MIYFGYPLDIHGWKPKPETEPETKPKSELENRERKTNTKPETTRTPESPRLLQICGWDRIGWQAGTHHLSVLVSEMVMFCSNFPVHACVTVIWPFALINLWETLH